MNHSTSLQAHKQTLPIVKYKDRIVECIDKNQVTLLIGTTGSGKSTQVPQFLYEANYGKKGIIGISEPRRIAVTTLANRVSIELNQRTLGHLVGFAIRFQEKVSKFTRLKFITDGLLVRESLLDPYFKKYSTLIIDEAHERSLRTDILLGLIKRALSRRQDLKVIIMSATLQYNRFLEFFESSALMVIPGHQFPIQIFYTPIPEQDYIEAAMITVLQIHLSQPTGDILVFLPGQDDIEGLCGILKKKNEALLSFARERSEHFKESNNLHNKSLLPNLNNKIVYIGQRTYPIESKTQPMLVMPLYSTLSHEDQAQVFVPTCNHLRKVVIATNIAETSITIPGIKYVVDCGLAKFNDFNPKTGIEELTIREISKSSADQRSGRAGREHPGQAYRLFTELSFLKFEKFSSPEILRSNLTQVYLELKAIGIESPEDFDFIDIPSRPQLAEAGTTLKKIKALDKDGKITDLGFKLASIPLDPLLGATLIHSIELECTAEILSILAMLSTDSLFYTPRNMSTHQEKVFQANRKRLMHESGDHLSLLNTYLLYSESSDKLEFCKANGIHFNSMISVENIRNQLKSLLHSETFGIKTISECYDMKEWHKVRHCLAKGCIINLARLDQTNRTYITETTRQTVNIHPTSVFFGKQHLPSWVVFSKFLKTSKPYIKEISIIDPIWVQEMFFKK